APGATVADAPGGQRRGGILPFRGLRPHRPGGGPSAVPPAAAGLPAQPGKGPEPRGNRAPPPVVPEYGKKPPRGGVAVYPALPWPQRRGIALSDFFYGGLVLPPFGACLCIDGPAYPTTISF